MPHSGFRRFVRLMAWLALCAIALVILLNAVVLLRARAYIHSSADTLPDPPYDCILVLGCGVTDDGTPSAMLRDRLETALCLYQSGAASKILVSGDHGQTSYDEVNVMKGFLVDAGVPSQDVFMDHAGFSTYESVVRARDVFCVRRVVIVTQRYHLYRAVFLAQCSGLQVCGVPTQGPVYAGAALRLTREIAARCKDVFWALIHPAPTFGGEPIPVNGNGNLTNDAFSQF